MTAPFVIRRASAGDAGVIARHRVEMFRDMGRLDPSLAGPLAAATREFVRTRLPDGSYLGWLAAPADRPAEIVAGAGVQLRPLMPRPQHGRVGLRTGAEGIIVNVYTERPWRRRGAARALLEDVLAWARGQHLGRLVLHASDDGRPLYAALGFTPTNEMRYSGEL